MTATRALTTDELAALYPDAADPAEAYRVALERASVHGAGTLAGWELLIRPREPGQPMIAVRILSDVEDRLPESIARWTGAEPYSGPPDCRTMIVEVPGPAGEPPGLRVIYETIGTPGPTGPRIVRALYPDGRATFVGLRPPSEAYYAGLPGCAPSEPVDASEG